MVDLPIHGSTSGDSTDHVSCSTVVCIFFKIHSVQICAIQESTVYILTWKVGH